MRRWLTVLLLCCLGCNQIDDEYACTPRNHCVDTAGVRKCEPRYAWEDAEDTTNFKCVPIPRYDPCDPNPCITKGRTICVVSGGTRYCECDAGYHLEGYDCVADDACYGVTCSGRGTCVLEADQASCDCDLHYRADGQSCVYARALDLLPAECGRAGTPALVWEEVGQAGTSPVAPEIGMRQEPGIALTAAGEIWIAYQGAGTAAYLKLATRAAGDTVWQEDPAFGLDFNGFTARLAVGGSNLFLIATGRVGGGHIDQVRAGVRTGGEWELFELSQNPGSHPGFGRLDLATTASGHAAIATRRSQPTIGVDYGWLSDVFWYDGSGFTGVGETSFFCGVDAGVGLSAGDDLWTSCQKVTAAEADVDPVQVSRYGGILWSHWDVDEFASAERWRQYLDAELDRQERLHMVYEGLADDGGSEAAYALFDSSSEETHYARFGISFATEAVDFSDGGATLVLDGSGCPLIVGRIAGSQEVTYVAPRSTGEWEVAGVGINSATRVDAVWSDGALHLVVVDPATAIVRYARATWPQ